jgi:hypothetical protein
MEVLTANLACGEEVLPVFSFEDEANMFLRLGGQGNDWRARETTGGELVSVLCGPCASVDRVVLDPIPLPGQLARGLNALLSTEREAFVGSLLNPWRFRSPGSGRSHATPADKDLCTRVRGRSILGISFRDCLKK